MASALREERSLVQAPPGERGFWGFCSQTTVKQESLSDPQWWEWLGRSIWGLGDKWKLPAALHLNASTLGVNHTSTTWGSC